MIYGEQVAKFVNLASFDDISGPAHMRPKIHILDSLGRACGGESSLTRNEGSAGKRFMLRADKPLTE